MHRIAGGFTLVEVLIGAALAAMLVGLAWPAWRESLAAARRVDGTAALERLHAAQERRRANVGAYASNLAELGVGERSDQGHWRVAVLSAGPLQYRAVAEAITPDARCPALQIAVDSGFATRGPAARCWR